MGRIRIGMEYFLCLAAYFEFVRVGKCVDFRVIPFYYCPSLSAVHFIITRVHT
jgi:hypothetical protein